MLYHVIRRSSHNNTNFSNKSASNYKNGSIPKLMPRYHYSRNTPNTTTSSTESFFPRHHSNVQSAKPTMTATTTSNSNNNHNNQYSYGSFKSSFIPLVTNIRTMTPNKREFIPIPITREDGTSITNNPIRSIPITFISDTNSSPMTATNNNNNNNNTINTNSNNGNNINPKPHYTSLLRPSSRYSQHHSINNGEESSTNIPRLPSVSRRLSLTIPVMTTTTTTKTDDDIIKQNSSSNIRQIPIRLSQPSNAASIPTNSSRISSAILRSSTLTNPLNNHLKRQKTDLTDASLSDLTTTTSSSSPVRRAEVMAREAIQGVVRFQQQQQQQQQRNDSISDNNTNNNNTNNNNIPIRSPGLSRRVIINLKNNQSVSLDSRLSSANSSLSKPPPIPSSARVSQRNNVYHIPVLHDIQMPSHPATLAAETSFQIPQSPSASNRNNYNSFKNEFRMEIPVTVITSNKQENSIQENDHREDGIVDYDPQVTIVTERIPSANGNTNHTLKSILKRSSSRENVARKNVSFMNT